MFLSCPASQYPLYTIIVFDEWEQGIPVAFTIQGKSREVDIVPWLTKLNARCIAVQPDWRPNAFLVDNDQAELNAIRLVPKPLPALRTAVRS